MAQADMAEAVEHAFRGDESHIRATNAM